MTPRPAIAAVIAALAVPCSGQAPLPDQDIAISVTTDASRVELGVAFPLTVVRSWSSGLIPEEWSDEQLAPLVVRLRDVRRRSAGRDVEETRTYDAYAFQSGELTVPAPWFRARPPEGGADRIALADDLRFEVTSALGAAAGDEDAVELPPGPIPPPFPWVSRILLAVLAAAVLGSGALWARRRWRRPEMRPAPPPVPAHVRALQRLGELRERSPDSREEMRADSVEASSLVRDYIEERFALRAPDMTTDEFLTHPQTTAALRPAHRNLLTDFLEHCDLVKFARLRPAPGERRRQLDAAEAFLRETAVNGTEQNGRGSR